MPRVIISDAQGPEKVEVGGEAKWICRCGLSKNQPFCDGSHKATLDEDSDTLYQYDDDGNRKEVTVD